MTDRLSAQPKPGYSPSSTHVFPAGARRGTTVKVRVGAECIPPGTDFLMRGEGISKGGKLTERIRDEGEASPKREPTITPITYPREWASELTIDEDAPLGPAYWHVNCAQGGTGSRPFLIGDLPEFIETESNSSFAKAEQVNLPITLNGQICGERDVDCFRFTAEAGQIISCEVIAGRIGSRLDPVLELLDARGKKVDAQLAHVGSDPVLVFQSQSTAEYVLRISNVTFGGDPAHVYRINVRPDAFPRLVLPGGVSRDKVSSGDLSVHFLTGDHRNMMEKLGLALPDRAKKQDRWTAFDPFVGPLTLSIDDYSPAVEQEPNDDSSTPQTVKTPTVLYGQFGSATDRDSFRIAAKKGEALRIEASAWPPGTPSLPVLSVATPDGKSQRVSQSVNVEDRVCRLTWTAKEDGDVVVNLKDLRHGGRGGKEFGWRLLIAPDEKDFALEASSDLLIVTQGTTSTIEVKARRHGGLNEPIDLSFEGLPVGVTVEAAQISKGKSSAKVKLTATDEARSASYSVRVIGKTKSGDETLERVARFRHLGIDSEGISIGSPTTTTLNLSVQHKPLFRLYCPEAYLYAHRGSVFPYPMEVERLNGFAGPVLIEQGDRQNRDMDGVEMLDTTVLPDQKDFFLPIYLPETMAINVQSQSQLYSQAWATFKDSHGQDQAVLVLSEKRNMLRSMPPVVKLKSVDESVKAAPGETIPIRLRLQRTSNFTGPMKVELHNHSPESGIALSTAQFAAGERELTVKIAVTGNPSSKPLPLVFRATGQLRDRKIISETLVELQIQP
ncbi:MAG: hypothetical protein H8E37_04505 [Planctomycetes bacterium]|nr:hypothetical protein [Planctomycetota bacterium]